MHDEDESRGNAEGGSKSVLLEYSPANGSINTTALDTGPKKDTSKFPFVPSKRRLLSLLLVSLNHRCSFSLFQSRKLSLFYIYLVLETHESRRALLLIIESQRN